MRRFRIAVLTLVALAAAPSAEAQARLQRVPLPALADHGPERLVAALAVSPTGMIAFTHGFDPQGRLVTLVDSTGKVQARFARSGDGPGEFRQILRLFIGDNTVFVFAAAKLAAFDLQGRHLWTRSVPPTALITAIHGDSADALVSQDPLRSLGLQRLSLRTMTGRTVIPDRGPPLHALSRSRSDSARTAIPAIARLGDDLIIGNGQTYRLARISGDGRLVAEFGRTLQAGRLAGDALDAEIQRRLAAARRTFRGPDGQRVALPVNEAQIRREASQPRPFFSGQTHGLQSDGARRVYAVIPGTEYTFIDVFEGDAFVGRTSVACGGRRVTASGAGRFLALLCEASLSADGEAELKLFRFP